jgi:hypothetical protein
MDLLMIVDRNLRNPGGNCPRSWPPTGQSDQQSLQPPASGPRGRQTNHRVSKSLVGGAVTHDDAILSVPVRRSMAERNSPSSAPVEG